MNNIEAQIIEDILTDADLFLKYKMYGRAIAELTRWIERYPSNFDLRWKLAEIYLEQRLPQAAAEQMVAVANLYVSNKQFDLARAALYKVREIYPTAPQIDVWLKSIDDYERSLAQTPSSQTYYQTESSTSQRKKFILEGDLRYISLFDIVQTIEKNALTCILSVSGEQVRSIYFNNGIIADVVFDELRGKQAFKRFAETTEGRFTIEKSPVEFQSAIGATSNAQLILEVFADEEEEPVAENEQLESSI
ncbi:MAG: DUF4388 domain-containing protein [Acidobacteriota bacterium]|nr:DUF4388 domain-containing protein [Blastocatellia bacterium]MDW8413109.1 DUF4388 domain-containing protein [Acidobacteriota bacterium]